MCMPSLDFSWSSGSVRSAYDLESMPNRDYTPVKRFLQKTWHYHNRSRTIGSPISAPQKPTPGIEPESIARGGRKAICYTIGPAKLLSYDHCFQAPPKCISLVNLTKLGRGWGCVGWGNGVKGRGGGGGAADLN